MSLLRNKIAAVNRRHSAREWRHCRKCCVNTIFDSCDTILGTKANEIACECCQSVHVLYLLIFGHKSLRMLIVPFRFVCSRQLNVHFHSTFFFLEKKNQPKHSKAILLTFQSCAIFFPAISNAVFRDAIEILIIDNDQFTKTCSNRNCK